MRQPTSRDRSGLPPSWPLTVLLAAAGAAGCARSPRPDAAPVPDNVAWIRSTCAYESPDTSGWCRHHFADLSIAVPAEYAVSRPTERSIRFVRGTGTLTLSIATSVRSAGLHARPARPQNEASCFLTLGGYPAVVAATAYGHELRLDAEWEGVHFWPPGDWRRRLHAIVMASRARDATVLRQALRTIVADRDTPRGSQ